MSVFSSLWQEISTVLVDLGLDQGEIDKLKAEHIGEEDYIDLLRAWSESEEDTKSQLRDIRNIQIQMHKDVVDLHQNQKEDQKTLEDTKSKLEEFSQCQVKTLEAVEEMQAGIEGFKQVAESEKKRKEENREVEALKSLADVDFRGDIEYHVQRFQEGTREWIFQKIDGWLDDKSCENRVMVISGNAGMGKSVISAVVCERMQEAGRLSGSHFCQHNNVRYRNPQLMLQSLASHLTHTLPEYKAALVEKLSRNLGVPLNSMGVEELFALLLKEPLHAIQDPGRNILMVIDGLDESEYQGRNELLDVIGKHFCKLPKWIRFLVTARPEINITESLKHLQPIHLNQKQEENLNDIKRFFELRLGKQLEQEHKNAFLDKLVQRTEGIFLFAYFLSAVLEENALPLTLEEVESRLPLGISSVYLDHFTRLEKELCKELKIEEDQVLRFLCALTASREPLPLAFASRILEPDGNCSISRRKVNKIIACISALLPIYHDRLHYIHKSVKDWLTNTSLYGRHKFIVDEKEGHEILFDLCNAELDKIKGKKLLDSQFNDAEQYALQHGVQHMTELDGLGNSSTTYIDHLVKSYVLDLELIFCRLCVNSMVPSDDLKSVQRNINVTSLQEGSCSSILYMSKALRKHSHLLRDHPEALFQSLVNEGPPELSVKAAQILENKLPHASYMKYLDKEEEQGVVLGRFCCSDTVACFDVSPELDYMVCECRDGTIHLWSLQTGSEEWKRPSLIAKKFEGTSRWGTLAYDEGAFRRVRCCVTFYRSVVFDGSGKYVLPGCLRNVYTLNGESYELFPKSDCVFSNCAFSGDRRTFLTDCGDDPKKLSLWSLENGAELYGIPLKEIIVSFALSQDGSLVAVTDDTGSVYVIDLDSMRGICLWQTKFVPCGLMHLSFDVEYTLVCGYLGTQLEDIGSQHRFVWNYENSDFKMCSFGKEDLFSSSAGVSWPLVPEGKFLLWPIGSSNFDLQDFYLQVDGETCLVENVSRVFPDLRVGFYARLSDNTILASGPLYNYVALVDVSHRDCSAKSSAVKEVVLSLEGDTLYSICSDNSSSEVTVLRLSTRESLMPKKSFAVPSLFLLSLKEGVVLCLGNGIPELWNFELTRLIRPLPKLSGYERLSRISPALIACQRYSRHLTTEEYTSQIPSFEGTDLPEVVASNSNSSVDTETPSVVHDSTDVSDDAISPNPFDLLRMQQPMMHLSLITHRVLEVDIFNVTSEEVISSWKTKVYSDESIKFVYCNIRGEFLVCSCKEIDDDILDIDCEELTVWWRKNNSITKLWERKSRIYGGDSFSPQFLISPKEEFVVTWDSLYAGCGLHILDARCGETKHHLLKNRDDIVDCQFTCNDESLLCCTSDHFCRLFHLRTGELLCLLDIEERPFSLGACTRNDLVAVGLSSGRLKFIHVKLPRRKESESKGLQITSAPEMATSSPSPMASSVEKTNGAKADFLLMAEQRF
ncbi:Vegetative incompatibility protein HET-E-1 [Stylophora pistillata]|uniref:Vegetative incompatibility protein HET-E-1 n=1 Tax=Stylophora pistillata TaxID=50429 RepID=A0A2B4S2V3_STYPI|nr:Vegetative incompatibility protein HET-E-1 [Stylophora pistillata]